MLQGHNAYKSEETGPGGAELTSVQTYSEAKLQHDNSSSSSQQLSHSQSALHRVSGSGFAHPMPTITPELERQLQVIFLVMNTVCIR